MVAYFDRLVRSLKVQLEVIERAERAGGEIFALDHGKLTNGTVSTARLCGWAAADDPVPEVVGRRPACESRQLQHLCCYEHARDR